MSVWIREAASLLVVMLVAALSVWAANGLVGRVRRFQDHPYRVASAMVAIGALASRLSLAVGCGLIGAGASVAAINWMARRATS